MYKRIEEPTKRFWKKVQRGQPQECWEYLGHIETTGYARFAESHSNMKMAHRFAWEITFGKIPRGKCVCHSCNNKKCCNPKHLYLATRQLNSTHAKRDGLYAIGERNGLSKLTEQQVIKIRELDKKCPQWGTRAWLAEIYSVSDTLISHICNRKIWKHI